MPVGRDYPFLTTEPGPDLIDRALRNQFHVEKVLANNSLNVVSRTALNANWLLKYVESLKKLQVGVPVERSKPAVGDNITLGEMYGYAVGTPAWHATNILFWIEVLVHVLRSNQEALSESDVDKIIDAGIRLGAAIKESQIDGQFSDPLLSGLNRRETLRRSSADANAKRQARATTSHGKWREAAKEIWKRNPRHTTSACAELVIKHLRLVAAKKTVADQIRDLKPKKVGEAG
jgi:hypothetical protein